MDRKLVWEIVKSGVIGMAAVFSFIASQQAELAKNEAEKARFAAEQKSQQSTLDIKAYELVEKALSLDASLRKGHAIAAAAIVNALTRPPLRIELNNALLAVITDKELVRRLEDAMQFDLDEAAPPPAPRTALPGWGLAGFLVPSAWAQSGGLRDYSVDLFYCEGSSPDITNARRARAQKALERIKQSNTTASARVRFLPKLVQARPGYQSFKDEIRFDDQGKDKAAAAELAKIVGVTPFAVRPVEQRTLYLSAFYCAG